MTISNIRREPRREITESLVGIGVFAVLSAIDFGLAVWGHADDPSHSTLEWACMWFFALAFLAVVVAIALLVVKVFLLATHAIGESVCNSLETRGIRLRPRQRY